MNSLSILKCHWIGKRMNLSIVASGTIEWKQHNLDRSILNIDLHDLVKLVCTLQTDYVQIWKAKVCFADPATNSIDQCFFPLWSILRN